MEAKFKSIGGREMKNKIWLKGPELERFHKSLKQITLVCLNISIFTTSPVYIVQSLLPLRNASSPDFFPLKSFPKAAAKINFLCCHSDNVTPFLKFPLMAFAGLCMSGSLLALLLGQTPYFYPDLFKAPTYFYKYMCHFLLHIQTPYRLPFSVSTYVH